MKVADLLVSRLVRAGARAVFGLPGGGSNLDVMAAARRLGLPFVLAHTETAGAIMAAAQAEITGAPGVCLSTLGPGVSSIVNGVAHAYLDRVPLVVLSDALDRAGRARFEHQNLPHPQLLGPITRLTAELTPSDAAAIVEEAIARAIGPPPGPVHLDCTGEVMMADVLHSEGLLPSSTLRRSSRNGRAGRDRLPVGATRLLGDARRPLVIAGLGARGVEDASALRTLCDRHALPVLLTYKAKGIVGDSHPSYAGLFTLGEIERPLVERADVLITVGLDPVELLPRPWPWTQPVVHCARWSTAFDQMPAGEAVIGDIAGTVGAVGDALRSPSGWTATEITAQRDSQRAAVRPSGPGFTPGHAIATVADAASGARHVTVDAGAHMFPAMALVPAESPGRILISNGLSTMGYALPAAIGAALLAPADPVVAITGDAGLLLCLGELRTAAREGLRVVVIVLADGELSLIRIKQDRRRLDPDGVRIGAMDWPLAARAMGLRGSRARDASALHQQVVEALAADGPTLIEAQVDPACYGEMLRTLRG